MFVSFYKLKELRKKDNQINKPGMTKILITSHNFFITTFPGWVLWWLILCVNLTGPQVAWISGQTLFWMRVFQIGIDIYFGRLKWSKLPSLMWVGLIQSAKVLNRAKNADLHPRENSLLLFLNWDTSFFLHLDWNWSNGSSWVLSLPALRMELCH